MLSIHEWKAMNGLAETTAEPITDAEPNEDDLQYYKNIKLSGIVGRYLTYFTDSLEGIKSLNKAKRGFIVQEVMDALDLSVPDITHISSYIARARRKEQALQQHQPQQPQPQAPQAPVATTPNTNLGNTAATNPAAHPGGGFRAVRRT